MRSRLCSLSNHKRCASWFQTPKGRGQATAKAPSREEILDSLSQPVAHLQLDGLAVDQVLQDLHLESTSALPDAWTSNMTDAVLVPELQFMLRSALFPSRAEARNQREFETYIVQVWSFTSCPFDW